MKQNNKKTQERCREFLKGLGNGKPIHQCEEENEEIGEEIKKQLEEQGK